MSECGCDGTGWIAMDPPEVCSEEYRKWWIMVKPARMCKCNPRYRVTNPPSEYQFAWKNHDDGGKAE